MPLYTIDPLHPDRLRCELCGHSVAALPPDGESPAGALTAAQVAHQGPELAGDVGEHDLLCGQAAEETAFVRVVEG